MSRALTTITVSAFVFFVGVSPICFGSDHSKPDRPPYVIVLNAKSATGGKFGSVSFLGPEEYRKKGSTDVGGTPVAGLFGPDEEYLYVLNNGKKRKPSSLSIVDLNERLSVAEIRVGINSTDPAHPLFGRWAQISRDGSRIYAISVGKEKELSTILIIDRTAHAPIRKLATHSNAIAYEQSRDGRLVHVLHAARDEREPARLVTVDVSELKILSTKELAFGGSFMRLSSDGDKLVVLCLGPPNEDGKGDGSGKMWILDGQTGREIQMIDLGYKPKWAIDPRTESLWINSRSKPGRSVVRVINNGQITREFEIATDEVATPVPIPNKDSIAFLHEKKFIALKSTSGEVADRRLRIGLRASYCLVSEDGRRGFAKDEFGSKVAILDLEAGELMAKVATGRASAKIGMGLGAFVSPLGMAVSGLIHAGGPAQTGMALDRDGKYLYAINVFTCDVTIIDAETGEIVDKIATGADTQQLLLSPNGRYAITVSREKVKWIDTQTNAVAHQIEMLLEPMNMPGRICFREDRGEALVPTARGVEIVSLATAKRIKGIGILPLPKLILIPESLGGPCK